MNSITPLPYTQLRLPIPIPIPNFHLQMWQWRPTNSKTFSLSFSPRRRRRRPTRRNPNRNDSSQSSSSDSGRLQFVLDVEQLKSTAPVSLLQRTLTYCESKLDQFVASGTEAYRDLQSLVTVEPGSNRIVVSCKDSTVWFIGGFVIWSCVVIVVVRVLVSLGLGLGLGFRRRNGGGSVEVVRRRDRSLGGREVVVERRDVEIGQRRGDVRSVDRGLKSMSRNLIPREERKLPNWWPVSVPSRIVELNREEYQREAYKLIQAMMDDKLKGKDISEDDILNLRRICRTSGVQLSFATENSRDSLYRSSVHNVINTCSKARSPSVQIDGEDACMFVAGLAHNFGLTALRAATIVSAAVAAQTRLWFLQAWALELQARHLEAREELKKICTIHQIFPPEPSSPEMEMVGRGLQKHLKLEQRQFLLNTLVSICGESSPRSAAEALGLGIKSDFLLQKTSKSQDK